MIFNVKFSNEDRIYRYLVNSLEGAYYVSTMEQVDRGKVIDFDYIEDEQGNKFRPHVTFNPVTNDKNALSHKP